MNKSLWNKTLAACALSGVASLAHAYQWVGDVDGLAYSGDTTIITFDNLPEDSPIYDQYADAGVSFMHGKVLPSGATDSLGGGTFTAKYRLNEYAANLTGSNGFVQAHFDEPIINLSFFAASTRGSHRLTVTFYTDGEQLGESQIIDTTRDWTQYDLMPDGPANSVMIITDRVKPVLIDDFQFTTAVLLPIDKSDCMKGAWRDYGIFKNQGDCVSYVATEGRNSSAY